MTTTFNEASETIASWERDAAAATGGPWTWDEHWLPTLSGHKVVPANDEHDGYSYETEVIDAEHDGGCGCRRECLIELRVSPADRAFIATSRTAVPALASIVQDLSSEETARAIVAVSHDCSIDDLGPEDQHLIDTVAAVIRAKVAARIPSPADEVAAR